MKKYELQRVDKKLKQIYEILAKDLDLSFREFTEILADLLIFRIDDIKEELKKIKRKRRKGFDTLF